MTRSLIRGPEDGDIIGVLHVELDVDGEPVSRFVMLPVRHPLVQDQRWAGYEAAVADLRIWAGADPMLVPIERLPLLNAARALARHLLHEPKAVITTDGETD